MSPGGEEDYAIGQKIETPYGEGVVQSTSRESVTVFIRGQGSHKFAKADLGEGSAAPSEISEGDGPSPFASRDARTRADSDPGGTRAQASPSEATPSPKPPTCDLPAPELKPVSKTGEGSGGADPAYRRAVIESLRLGTVPSFAVRDATVSRDSQIGRIESVISSVRDGGKGGILLFTGPNGSGKTHLLRLTEQAATDARFLVARAELEGATKLTPKDVYREAVTNLQWRSSDGRVDGTLRRFLTHHEDDLQGLDLAPLSDSRVLYYLLRRIQKGREIAPEVWDYIHGDERYAEDLEHTRFKTTWLAFWGTAGQSLGNALNGLAYLSRVLGYGGFSLVLDETELLLNQDVDWAVRGREWLRGLVLSVQGGSFQGANGERFEEWETRPYRVWQNWPGQNIWKSRQEWSLRYGGVDPSRDPHSRGDPLPYAPCGEVPFLLALGYTDQPDSDATVFDEADGFQESWLPPTTVDEGIFEMEPPRTDDVTNLIHQIGRLYVEGYPDSREQVSEALSTLEDDLAGLIQARLRTGAASSIRWAIQTVIETLDRAAAGIGAGEIRRSLTG